MLNDDVGVRPYAEILEDMNRPEGMRLTMHNTLLPELREEVFADVAALVEAPPTMVSLRALGGAFSRTPETGTAFPGRLAQALVTAVRLSTGADAAARGEIPGWDRVARHGTDSYGNFQSSLSIPEAGTPREDRLARIRDAYDPDGLFSQAEGTQPAVAR